MNSLCAQAFKQVLRLQQPILFSIRHPHQLVRFEPLLVRLLRLPTQIKQTEQLISHQRVMVLRNQRDDTHPARVLVYLHGGGYNVGSPNTHKVFAARLMQAAQLHTTYLPYYRRAPEHPFPAALDDVLAVWRELIARHPNDQIILAGESAGGGLCLALCQQARQLDLRLPDRLYLHSPWLDVGLTAERYTDLRHHDAFLGRHPQRQQWLHRVFARHYIGTATPNNPLLSPIYLDPTGFPPLLIQTGSEEVFLQDSQTLSARYNSAGLRCTLEVWHGMWHAFAFLAPPWLPEANQAIRRVGQWLKNDTPRCELN